MKNNFEDVEFVGFPDLNKKIEVEEPPKKTTSKKAPSDFPNLSNLPNGMQAGILKITPENIQSIIKDMEEMQKSLRLGPFSLEGLMEIAKSMGVIPPDESEETSQTNQQDPLNIKEFIESFFDEKGNMGDFNGDIFKAIAVENGKPVKMDITLDNSGSFLTLKNNPQLSAPCAVMPKGILADFFQEFGEKEVYDMNIFVSSEMHILGTEESNDTEIVEAISKIRLIDSTDKYLVFRAETENPSEESFIVTLAKEAAAEGGEFIFYVPKFGNTLSVEDGKIKLFNKDTDEELFDEFGNIKSIADISKIKAEANLVFYDGSPSLVSVADFGKILHVSTQVKSGQDIVLIGSIHSNNSYKARQFIRDYGFEPEERKFNFYVKLSSHCDSFTVNSIAEFLTTFNFLTNPMIQNAAIKPVDDGIGIEIDLAELERNIKKWRKEK